VVPTKEKKPLRTFEEFEDDLLSYLRSLIYGTVRTGQTVSGLTRKGCAWAKQSAPDYKMEGGDLAREGVYFPIVASAVREAMRPGQEDEELMQLFSDKMFQENVDRANVVAQGGSLEAPETPVWWPRAGALWMILSMAFAVIDPTIAVGLALLTPVLCCLVKLGTPGAPPISVGAWALPKK